MRSLQTAPRKISTFIDSLCGSSSYLVLLVGTLNGDPLPKGDAARYKLIIERKALLTFVPLNYEVLFGRPEPACSHTWVRTSAAAA